MYFPYWNVKFTCHHDHSYSPWWSFSTSVLLPAVLLDGYCVGKGISRQFVAMPLGEGYTAKEQLSGAAEHGGLQSAP